MKQPILKSMVVAGAAMAMGIAACSSTPANGHSGAKGEPLVMFNIMKPTQAPIPWLATAYKWSDGGKTLTFTIRKGVKFSDGKPMTASDVAFTFNLLKNNPSLTPASPPPVPASATAPNPTTAV